MHRSHYSRFLSANPNRLHFAAHSHHYWLDATREAHLNYWDDSARLADKKWAHVFSTVVPKAQRHIARLIDLSCPEQIAFAPNTHEFVVRLLSCFERLPIRILTTDGEFHSFSRQIARLEESGKAHVVRIPVEPFESFEDRFASAIERATCDLVFFSHVFFNSGFVVENLERVVSAASSEQTLVVIDGYHSFCAIPFSMKPIERRAFYLSGGYKYAQAGEGVCFLCVPKGCALRPMNTGWFAEFGALSNRRVHDVAYASDGFRFFGATFDPSGLYRWNAVGDWLEAQNLSVAQIHDHAKRLQKRFLEKLSEARLKWLTVERLVPPIHIKARGNFLTFDVPNAEFIEAELSKLDVVIDRRGARLRFGFGLYQTEADIDALFERLRRVAS
ncbi:MAG: aminotransferase class V-fold PLP-dependent enzyme [Chloroherpetonaceae bacterium]|nr:aminotransferase class V-fold PLP-dependent enzyme [Chloroherpetonaceae bacterium]MDW8437885.1 aminotransferase class V-fold PLP-dependent enzyme [Chloroherpetonaceae bacterium]